MSSIKSVQNIPINSRNTEIPFFPDFSYYILQADVISIVSAPTTPALPVFSWLSAFYNYAEFTGFPILAVWSGLFTQSGVPIVSPVAFSYPGERINIKGNYIVTSGIDIRGNAVTSTVIGGTAATQVSSVIAYGGIGG